MGKNYEYNINFVCVCGVCVCVCVCVCVALGDIPVVTYISNKRQTTHIS